MNADALSTFSNDVTQCFDEFLQLGAVGSLGSHDLGEAELRRVGGFDGFLI